jgi:hypothetical protein
MVITKEGLNITEEIAYMAHLCVLNNNIPPLYEFESNIVIHTWVVPELLVSVNYYELDAKRIGVQLVDTNRIIGRIIHENHLYVFIGGTLNCVECIVGLFRTIGGCHDNCNGGVVDTIFTDRMVSVNV